MSDKPKVSGNGQLKSENRETFKAPTPPRPSRPPKTQN